MKTACILGVLVLSLSLCGSAVHAEDTFAQSATTAAETWLGHVGMHAITQEVGAGLPPTCKEPSRNKRGSRR